MQVKNKPCKGTGKAKNFESCGTLQKFRKYGLGIECKCYSKWLRESLEGQEMILKASKKAKMYSVVEDRKIYNKEKKDRKWELMSKAQKIQAARKVFQKWIRNRDINLPCISCGTLYSEEWHGSHYKNANEYSLLIFNEDNVNRSCLRCNKFLHGAKETYRTRLIEKIGIERVLYLDSIPPNVVHRYSDEELKSIIDKYKLKK